MAPWALPSLPRAACCVRQQGQASPLQREADIKLGLITSKDDGFAAAWDILGEIKKINSSMREMLRRWCMYAKRGLWLVGVAVLPGWGSQTAGPQHPPH